MIILFFSQGGQEHRAQPLSMTNNDTTALDLSAADLGGGLYGPLSSALQRPRECGNPRVLFSCFKYVSRGFDRFKARYSSLQAS